MILVMLPYYMHRIMQIRRGAHAQDTLQSRPNLGPGRQSRPPLINPRWLLPNSSQVDQLIDLSPEAFRTAGPLLNPVSLCPRSAQQLSVTDCHRELVSYC